jgi:protein-disulfide isomerase
MWPSPPWAPEPTARHAHADRARRPGNPADGRTVELDVADHLALGERLGIVSTPTVLILDAHGVERSRATGAPTLAQARAALATVSGQ